MATFSTSTNLHSPGAIGDVTPGTIAYTTSTIGGAVAFSAHNTADIGSDAVRARNVYCNSIFSNGCIVTQGFPIGWNSGTKLDTPSDGIITIWNSANTDFNLVQIGGRTSSFPAIKRNGTALNFRLADDSADAPIKASRPTFSAIPTSSSGLSSGDVYSNAGILTIVP